MRTLETSIGPLRYEVLGEGPGLLVPWCNVDWLHTACVQALAEHCTVVVGCPRGFGASSRLPPGAAYSAESILADLRQLGRAAGLERFSVLGYSLTAAVGAWLAASSPSVDAVVAGGFPLLGAYRRVQELAEGEVAAETAAERSARQTDFDRRAALAFYRDLAVRPDDALVDALACPLLSFWGARDEILEVTGALDTLEADLARRGATVRVLEGLDHAGALLATESLVPDIVMWLDEHRR